MRIESFVLEFLFSHGSIKSTNHHHLLNLHFPADVEVALYERISPVLAHKLPNIALRWEITRSKFFSGGEMLKMPQFAGIPFTMYNTV